jgi:hypothetical protein
MGRTYLSPAIHPCWFFLGPIGQSRYNFCPPQLNRVRIISTADRKNHAMAERWLKSVTAKGTNVKQFEELLRAEFESKWETLRKRRSISQETLFDVGPSDGLNFSS